MKYKAIIFDLDGTLLNTLDDLAFSVNAVLSRHDFPTHPAESYKKFVGNGATLMVTRALPEVCRTQETIARCTKEVRELYALHMLDRTQPYDAIPQLLTALKDRRLKLAVLSNKPDIATRDLVEKSLGANVFDCIRGAVDSVALKPDPQASHIIAETLGVVPSDCMHVGDSATDMQTAAAAGMCSVGVLWGFREREELIKAGAQYIISQPMEILKLLF